MQQSSSYFCKIGNRLKKKLNFELQKPKRLFLNFVNFRMHTPGRSKMDEKYSGRYVRKAKILIQQSSLTNSSRFDLELIQLLRLKPSKIQAMSEECLHNLGIYPISFSIPYKLPSFNSRKRNFLISPIEPRKPYQYDVFDDYLETYSKSIYAITFKKGGWDCARHLEIMSVGSVPFFPDVNQLPRYTMIHYPKEFLIRVKTLGEMGYVPSADVHHAISKWAEKLMVSSVMSQYFLSQVKREFSSILFVDESLPLFADYLSLYSLIGLKKLFGTGIHELRKTDYIYTDDTSNHKYLYGRGFGFAKSIDSKSRDNLKFPELTTLEQYQQVFYEYDLVIVGNMALNPMAVRALEGMRSSTAKIYLRGNDLAPSKKELQNLAKLSGLVFSREIY